MVWPPRKKKKRKILIGSLAPGGGLNLKSSRSAEIRDSFWTPELPPLVTPRAAEPGPGVTTFIDTENNLSIVEGTPTDTLVNPASDTAFLCNVDHHLKLELTFDGSGVNIYTRFVDVNNYGARVTFHSNGNLFLFDNDGSGAAQLGFYSANFQVAQKYTCDLIVRGTVAEVYLDGVLRITYETLSNYLTQTGGYIYHTLAVNDLVLNSYPIDGEGILRCAGGLATPTWSDPAIHLGAEEESRLKAPGDQIPHVIRAGMAYACFLKPVALGHSNMGFDADKIGQPNLPRYASSNNTNFYIYSEVGSVILTPNYMVDYPDMSKYLIVPRSNSNGHHFIIDGKLLWTIAEDPVLAQGYVAFANYNFQADIYDIGFVDLAEDGYTNDFADVLVSEASPQSGASYTHGDLKQGMAREYTVNFDSSLSYFRDHSFWIDGDNYLRIRSNTNSLSVNAFVGGVPDFSENVTSVFAPDTSFKIQVVLDQVASTVSVYVDGVLKFGPQAIDPSLFNITKDSWALAGTTTVDDLKVNPYPALGIAHNHLIYPQAADTADHSEESIAIEIKNVTLPTDVVVAELRFRDGGGNHISVKWNQAGNVDVEDNGTPICAGTGVIADGQSIFVILDGNEAKLWANGVHIQDGTIVTALAGTGFVCQSMQDGAGAGQVNIWPANPPLPAGLKP